MNIKISKTANQNQLADISQEIYNLGGLLNWDKKADGIHYSKLPKEDREYLMIKYPGMITEYQP